MTGVFNWKLTRKMVLSISVVFMFIMFLIIDSEKALMTLFLGSVGWFVLQTKMFKYYLLIAVVVWGVIYKLAWLS